MADIPTTTDTATPATPAAASAGPESAGAAAAADVSASAAAAPVADASAGAAPAAAASPEASAAPAADGAAADAKPQSTPSLLEAAPAKAPDAAGDKPAATDAKPTDGTTEGDKKPAADAKPATDAKPADAKPADKPADAKPGEDGKPAPAEGALAEKPQARSYEAFKVPEGTKLDDKQVKSFTDVLDAAELSHQDRAQKLMDMHVSELQRVVQETTKHQQQSWDAFTTKLKDEFKADPDVGGNRQETALGRAKYVCEQLGGSPEQVADLMGMLTHTGMGNYANLVRVLDNAFAQLYEKRIVPGNPPSRSGARRSFQDVAYASDNSGGN